MFRAVAAAAVGGVQYGKATPPSGTFTTRSSGRDQTCGIRPGGTFECWGGYVDGEFCRGEAEDPTGTFTALAAGRDYTCGLGPDATVTCWGAQARNGTLP